MRQFLHRRHLGINALNISLRLMQLSVSLDASLLDGLEGVLFCSSSICRFFTLDALVHVSELADAELSRELVGADLGVLLGDRLFL